MREWKQMTDSAAPGRQGAPAVIPSRWQSGSGGTASDGAALGEARRLAEIQRLTGELLAIQARLRELQQPVGQTTYGPAPTADARPATTRDSDNQDAVAADRLMRRYVGGR